MKVPFRPLSGSPSGAIAWREGQVGVLARLCPRVRESGQPVVVLKQRRVVAVWGEMEALKPRWWLQALRPGLEQAPRVVWLSDAGAGLWRACRELFGACAPGILDFYPAGQKVWKAVKVGKDGRSRRAWQGWQWARRRMRYGMVDDVWGELYVERVKEH